MQIKELDISDLDFYQIDQLIAKSKDHVYRLWHSDSRAFEQSEVPCFTLKYDNKKVGRPSSILIKTDGDETHKLFWTMLHTKEF